MDIVQLLRDMVHSGGVWLPETLDELIETTLTGNIGGRDMPMLISKTDPAMSSKKFCSKEQKKKSGKFFGSGYVP